MNRLRPEDVEDKLGDIAAAAGLRRIGIVAWRDLDHPEAGGSEVHAARIAERWAAAGIDVTITASRAPDHPRVLWRDGYRVRRPAGRYSIFPVNALLSLADYRNAPDGTIEVWNGMPFLVPVWARHPRAVFIHHVHGDMWESVLPRPLGVLGKYIEKRIAPPLYRSTPVITLSESSRRVIIEELGFDPSRVTVVQPGVDECFVPGTERHPDPLVVAVGRLVPYKRFDRLVDVLLGARQRHPGLRAVIAGEGSERPALEAQIRANRAEGWLSLPGRLTDEQLIDLYQRAWLVVSTSAYEGWGLTITEAAACATPAVATPIVGHVDAVDDGLTGLLAEPGPGMTDAICRIVGDQRLRARLQRGAQERSQSLQWDRTALETLRVLASDRRSPAD